MTKTSAHLSISLDGYIAGPNQDRDNPIGIGGLELHRWHLAEPLHEGDARSRDHLAQPRGAYVMGRNMFGPIRGEWDEDWRGWWGDEPPYHAPVFVLTHYAHDPIEMDGGTVFHFVTDGFDAAYAQAVAVAGEREVLIAGGASTVRQAFAAGVLHELVLDYKKSPPIRINSGLKRVDAFVTAPVTARPRCSSRGHRKPPTRALLSAERARLAGDRSCF